MDRAVYRHELKYLINKPDWALLRMRLMEVLPRDANVGADGEYQVRSLYFDDYWDSAYQEKDMGVLTRKKYRVRTYNCSDSKISLERKKKYGQYIHKEAAPLTREQLEDVLVGEYEGLRRSPHRLLQEFYYECTSRIMRPRVIVDYDREPFMLNAGDVRITFDKHVRAGFGRFDLFDPDLPAVEVLPGDRMIMEVKFTQFLPGIVRRLLPPRASMLTAASKYVLCCDTAVRHTSINRTEGLLWTR